MADHMRRMMATRGVSFFTQSKLLRSALTLLEQTSCEERKNCDLEEKGVCHNKNISHFVTRCIYMQVTPLRFRVTSLTL